MPSALRALFVFAHQDDEYAAAPWIVEELAAGSAVACVYLTDGGSRSSPAVRDAESRAALHSLGVTDDRIAFLSDASDRIADGALAQRCADGLAMLERWIASTGFAPQRIYAPSYEGGHPDHDAAHVIAARIAVEHGITDDAWHFSLYNAYRCRKPFFAAFKQLPTALPSRRASISMQTRIALTFLCARYRSQRRTWMGLFPGAVWQRLIARRESVVRFDLNRLNQRPHEGELLYERMFGVTFIDFEDSMSAVGTALGDPEADAPREVSR
ncbi:MAG TPA: PIG-L family deacetylase [Candidatus Baltobacteraceae bacterium]|nr:PIG-L family deacetylase [Candidatus Baltobacteraceae bacterium]